MCNRNGKTYVNFLTPAPGGTDTSASYNLGLSYFTCGNRKMCVNSADGFPIVTGLNVQVLGAPQLIGNNQYCCNVRCICNVVYQPVGGCGCPQTGCPRNETVVATVCVPCSEATQTPVANGALIDPVNVRCGCDTTNEVALNISFTLNATT